MLLGELRAERLFCDLVFPVFNHWRTENICNFQLLWSFLSFPAIGKHWSTLHLYRFVLYWHFTKTNKPCVFFYELLISLHIYKLCSCCSMYARQFIFITESYCIVRPLTVSLWICKISAQSVNTSFFFISDDLCKHELPSTSCLLIFSFESIFWKAKLLMF